MRQCFYTILCYDSEETIRTWTKEHDDSVMVAKKGKLGPVARLRPTKSAFEVRPISVFFPGEMTEA